MRQPRLVVVGGGLSGLACALAGARAGADVHLYESRARDALVPGHVDIVPNMLRVLVGLGIADACVRKGFAYRRISAIGHRGLPLYSLDVPNLAGPRYPAALGMLRCDLYDALSASAREAGAVLHFGTSLLDLVATGARGVSMHFSDAATTHADLVVLATGTRDRLRERIFGGSEEGAGTSEWLYLHASRAAAIDEALHASSGTGTRAQVVPVNSTTVGVQLALRSPELEVTPAAVRTLLARFPGSVGALAEQIDPTQNITRRHVRPALLTGSWALGNVMVVGDGAHAFSPHFGQSAAQALEDAAVLGELLSQDLAPAEVARRWYGRRLPRVRAVMDITLRAARWDEAPDIDTDLLQLTRDLDEVVRQPA